MAGILLPAPIFQWIDDNFVPLANGLVYTFAAGTSTPLATYRDSALTSPNSNPILLDAFGKAVIYLGPFNYKIDVQTPQGVSIDGYPRDDVSGIASFPATSITGQVAVANGGTGDSTLAVHGVVIGNAASPVNVTTPGTAGQLLTSNGALADPTFQAAASVGASLVLLRSRNSSDISGGAATVDQVVLPALTAVDTLIIEYLVASVAQQTTTPLIFSVTDGVNIGNIQSAASLAAGAFWQGRIMIKDNPATPGAMYFSSVGVTSIAGAVLNFVSYGGTALWNSGWTLGLRHGGVTAGGTFVYQWNVYRLLGQ